MRIIHPHPVQGRQSFIGVEFVDGVATVDGNTINGLHPETVTALVQHGYVIEHEREAVDGEPDVKAPSKRSRRGGRARNPLVEDFGTVALADGSVVGDGSSIVTLHTDGTATAES